MDKESSFSSKLSRLVARRLQYIPEDIYISIPLWILKEYAMANSDKLWKEFKSTFPID